jgi:hypothetical protein
MLKWFRYLVLAFSVIACLPALAQQNFVTLQHVPSVSRLRTGSFIPMPTTHARGLSSLPAGVASPHAKAASRSQLTRGRRYPGDLEYQGGAVLPTAVQHAIFTDPSSSCPPNSCWGDPIGFLSDLDKSRVIHLSDQYVGTSAPHRYPVRDNFVVPSYTPSAGVGQPFTNLDLAILAYSAAAQTGGLGLGNIYHVFLAPGQDVCFDSTFSVCYSPDNFKTWAFCAYHGSAQDSAGNVVLYTVEPFQNVSGCNVRPDTPNGQLTDSTNNVLSHEFFETITDPVGDGWWNSLNNGIFGEEIADECSFLLFTATDAFFDPNLVRLNGNSYAMQPEYVNSQHACSTSASDGD